MAIDPNNIETVDYSQLETLNLALGNFFAHATSNGRLYKNSLAELATFLAPFVSTVGASSYVEVVGNALPNPVITTAFSIVGSGTYTQTGEANLVLTNNLNIISWNVNTWTLTKGIDINLSNYYQKPASNSIAYKSLFYDSSQFDLLGIPVTRPFIHSLELYGANSSKGYGISNVFRNKDLGGTPYWLVYIGSYNPGETAFSEEIAARFIANTDPYINREVTVYNIVGLNEPGLSGRISLDWGALPDGYANTSMFALNTLANFVFSKGNEAPLIYSELKTSITNVSSKVSSYPFSFGYGGRNASDDRAVLNFIKGVQLLGTKLSGYTYFFEAIWVNNSGSWLINVMQHNNTTGVNTLVCNFNTSGSNPKTNPSKVKIHPLTKTGSLGTDVYGYIAIDWSALPDGTNFFPMTESNYPLSDNVWTLNNTPYIKVDESTGVLNSAIYVDYPIQMSIPSVVHVAVGREVMLFWDTVSLYEERYNNVRFKVISDIGKTVNRGFLINPSSTGDFAAKIIAKDISTNKVLQRIDFTIRVSSAGNGSGSKNILMIGDSRTWQNLSHVQGSSTYDNGSNNKTITTELRQLLVSSGGFTPNFIGTQVSPVNSNVKNEAYSGWDYSLFLGLTSPFWDSVGGRLDFKKYMTDRGLSGQSIDIFTIMLGVNDIWTPVQDNKGEDISGIAEANIPTAIANAKTFINAILNATYGFTSAKIVLIIEPTTCSTQSGFGEWYGTNANRPNIEQFACEKALHKYREAVISNFDNGSYNANVILSAAGLFCDRTYGFPYIRKEIGFRTPESTELYHMNSIHPHDDGYKQIADGVFSTIKSIA